MTEVVTPRCRIGFGPDGGVRTWVIEYRGSKPIAVQAGLAPLSVTVQRAGQPPEFVPLQSAEAGLRLSEGQGAGRLEFSGVSPSGIRVRRTLEVESGSCRLGVTVAVDAPEGPAPLEATLYWTGPVALAGEKPGDPWVTLGEDGQRRQVLGRILVGRPRGDPEVFEAPAPALREGKDAPAGPELKEPNLVPDERVAGESGWVALENDYFIAALVPQGPAGLVRGRGRDLAMGGVVFGGDSRAGRAWEGRAVVYVGPKEWRQLEALGAGVEGAQARNYGHLLWIPWLPMWWFCVPLLWLMNFFGTRLPGQNYGIAIILLTVLVKLAFYPLSLKGMRSMKQMQVLQPQVNALRSKYRGDPQRFQREQMELFRQHRVNPMGGCLPMVVQVPIFYALYLTLQYSVELQGAPFAGWIADLSKKDPYYVLPVLMGASMLIQQKMTPTVADPRQARIMLIMPVVFTFMFLEFPTGLVLYWLVNNILSIAQQYAIDRSAGAGRPAGDAKETRRT